MSRGMSDIQMHLSASINSVFLNSDEDYDSSKYAIELFFQ